MLRHYDNCDWYHHSYNKRYRLFRVTAQIKYKAGDYSGSKSIPAFELNASVQGITDLDHAKSIARDILDPFGMFGEDLDISVSRV